MASLTSGVSRSVEDVDVQTLKLPRVTIGEGHVYARDAVSICCWTHDLVWVAVRERKRRGEAHTHTRKK